MDKLQSLVDADYAAGDGKRSPETHAAILAVVPASARAAVHAALKLRPQFSLRDHATAEAADLAARYRVTTQDDDEACELAAAEMAKRGWTISVETIHRAEFERRNQAVNAIRAARSLLPVFHGVT